MQKLAILPLTLVAMALSSCSGFNITVEDAETRLENILNLATQNGKYIGGKYLTRESTRSNITYDIDKAVVETHRVVRDFYFDIDNNYFRLDTVETDVITDYEHSENRKTVEVDYYLYVYDNLIYNTTLTKINDISTDKVVEVFDVTPQNIETMKSIIDNYYRDFISVFEESVAIVGEAISVGDQRLNQYSVELSSFGPASLSLFATGLVEQTNVSVDFTYNKLRSLQTFNRVTHEKITEEIDYDSFFKTYAM